MMLTIHRGGPSVRALLLCLAAAGCGGSGQDRAGSGGQNGVGGQGGAGNAPAAQATLTFGQAIDDQVDVLFVINDMASTGANQQKLLLQLPAFLNELQSGSTPLDLHIAVTTTDMGAASDVQASVGCMPPGDGGQFRTTPAGTCSGTTLAAGATYLADDGRGATNFTGAIAAALQCISTVGDEGCGFGQPLAAAVHALGADNLQGGAPTPPPANAGFLRPDAVLAIVVLSNEDDCSAPADTRLFSLQGQPDGLSNPLGPLDHGRCNRYGHLCREPGSTSPDALVAPPLAPPADARLTGAAPTLGLFDCQDNDTSTGLLVPVRTLAGQIKALKSDPDGQILVAALVAPASPYTVGWFPAGGQSGELWPEIMHSCGAQGAANVSPDATQFTPDGTFGDPGVRLTQFAHGFSNSLVASVCDASYASAMAATATQIVQLVGGRNCWRGSVQKTARGLPDCRVAATVANGAASETVQYPNCADDGETPPCWTANSGSPGCSGIAFSTIDAPGAASSSIAVTCSLPQP